MSWDYYPGAVDLSTLRSCHSILHPAPEPERKCYPDPGGYRTYDSRDGDIRVSHYQIARSDPKRATYNRMNHQNLLKKYLQADTELEKKQPWWGAND